MAPRPRAAWGGMAAAGRVTCRDKNGRGDGCGRPARLLPLLVELGKPGRFTILDSEGMWQGRGAGWWVG